MSFCNRPQQLGFFDIAAGISGLIATTAASGVTIYGTFRQLELAEEQAELQEELALRRMSLEEELSRAQQRILSIQTEGLEERQNIELEIARMQAAQIQKQLELVLREQELQTQIAEERAQRELEAIRSAPDTVVAASDQVAQPQKSPFNLYYLLIPAGLVGFFLLRKR